MSIVSVHSLYVRVAGLTKYLIQKAQANCFTFFSWVNDDMRDSGTKVVPQTESGALLPYTVPIKSITSMQNGFSFKFEFQVESFSLNQILV